VIIGSGDIASILNDRDDFIFFAAGVSNSRETDEERYSWEKHRLMTFIEMANALEKSLVYFGSFACYFSLSRYTVHKLEMEQMIKEACNNYSIIRIGNITWGKNPNTFINFIRNKIAAGEEFEIRDEFKYIISKEQLLFITDNLPMTGKNEISVFGDCKKVKDII
jgi:nucleoside-diphosphate-sugar epimerase